MNLLITIIWFVFFVLLLWKLPNFSKFNLQRRTLVFLFLIHAAAGVALSLIYTFYYPQRNLADTFKYYDDAKVLYKTMFTQPVDFIRIMIGYKCDNIMYKPIYAEMNHWFISVNKYLYNDNRTLIRLNAFVMIFSFGHYHVHVLFFAMLSLLGKLFFYKTFEPLFNDRKALLFIAIFLIPSVVFWSSGVMKEGPLFFILGLLCFSADRLAQNVRSVKYYMLSFLCFGALFFVKFYVAITILPGVITWFWLKRKEYRNPLKKTTIVHLTFALAAFAFHFISPFHSFVHGFKWQKSNFYGLAKTMNSGSVINTTPLENDLWSFITNIPEGLFNALFRPFLWDSLKPVMLASALENVLLILIFILCFYWFKKPNNTKLSFVLFCFSFTLMLFTLSGVVTPIIGTLVRYKIPAMSFLLMGCFLLWDEDKVREIKFFSRLNGLI